MIIDLLNTDDQVSYNINISNMLGLHPAIYLSQLINISKKANIKNKLIDDKYFKVDRKYILYRTTIDNDEQMNIENKLMSLKIIEKPDGQCDLIYLNIDVLSQILSCQDVEMTDRIKEILSVKTKKEVAMSQRNAIIRNMKNCVTCSNDELREALYDWVDSIYANPNGFLSKKAICKFYNDLNNYTKGDLDLALAIVETAAVKGYKDVEWAIKDYTNKKRSNIVLNKNPNVVVEPKNNLLSDESY